MKAPRKRTRTKAPRKRQRRRTPHGTCEITGQPLFREVRIRDGRKWIFIIRGGDRPGVVNAWPEGTS